jgi:predicted patatin/cPLA2 family phospholipase
MYADDTSILISNNSYEELNRILNDVLHNTTKWFQVNQLVLNMEKTKIVKFTPANP